MENKGFVGKTSENETLFVEDNFKKPFKSKDNQRKVDINILKARAQEIQNKENRKNISIFIFSILVLVALAVYLSS
tara:strand:+ start:133 stop:360 length:228 start_codon:yes stop_codon:yes gene_type:complete